MKHTIALLIALLPATAMATGVNQRVDIDVHTYSKAQASAQAKAQASAFGLGVGYGGAGGNSTATGGTSTATGGNATGGSTTITNEAARQAVSPAIAPSVGTGSDCQIATPSSLAGSVLIASLSLTTGVHYNDICYAYKRGQFDVADRMMCDKSAAYAKANPACKK